jgi:hypothetical protein
MKWKTAAAAAAHLAPLMPNNMEEVGERPNGGVLGFFLLAN